MLRLQTPALPRNFAGGDPAQTKFDGALTVALSNYLSTASVRINGVLPKDGSEAMEANLDMGGFAITNVSAITGTGQLEFATLRATSTTELTLASTGHALQLGPTAAANLALDINEVQARNNGAAAALELNPHGGAVSTGAGLTVANALTVTAGGATVTAGNLTVTAGNIIITTGLLDLSAAAAGQIKWPGTPNTSADPNTLTDFEFGTFTPAVTGSGVAGAGTYSVQAGKYVKIHDAVFVQGDLTWSAHTGTVNWTVTGLPFTASATYNTPIACVGSNLTFPGQLGARINASGTSVIPLTLATGAAAATFAIDTAATFGFAGFYRI